MYAYVKNAENLNNKNNKNNKADLNCHSHSGR